MTYKQKNNILIAILFIIILILIGFILFKYYNTATNSEYELSEPVAFLNLNKQPAKQLGFNVDYSCKAIHSGISSYSDAYKVVQTTFNNGTDNVALTETSDGKYLRILTGASVKIGTTSGDNLLVISDIDNVLTAVGQDGSSGTAHSMVQLNRTTGLAFWVKTSSGFLEDGLLTTLKCD